MRVRVFENRIGGKYFVPRGMRKGIGEAPQ